MLSDHMKREGRQVVRTKGNKKFAVFVSLHDIRKYINRVSPAGMNKCELNKIDTYELVPLPRKKPLRPHPCTKNYRQLKRARDVGCGCPQERTH